MIRVACEENLAPKEFRDDPSRTLAIAREMLNALRVELLRSNARYDAQLSITIMVRCDEKAETLDS